jgi:hypothetical protein
MNKEKILRFLHAVVNLATAVPLFAGTITPTFAVTVLAVSTALKEILLILGDILDDGQLNKSFLALALCALIGFGSGCVSYVRDEKGERLHSFLQKSTFEGLRVSPKTGLSIKSAETQGDGDMIRAIYEAGKAAASDAAKAAK